jgi:hypothetical protein
MPDSSRGCGDFIAPAALVQEIGFDVEATRP